jgi:hypothetical protein
LSYLENLTAKSIVYAEENGRKFEIDHENVNYSYWFEVRNKCETAECLCNVYKEELSSSLGGTSPLE